VAGIPAAVTAPSPSPPARASRASEPSRMNAATATAATAIRSPVAIPTAAFRAAAAENFRARSRAPAAAAIDRTAEVATLLRCMSRQPASEATGPYAPSSAGNSRRASAVTITSGTKSPPAWAIPCTSAPEASRRATPGRSRSGN
jgi:hypothetical protein